MSLLNLANFSFPSGFSDPNEWLDHFELLCCVSQEGSVSSDDVCDRLLDENGNNPGDAARTLGDEEDFPESLATHVNPEDFLEDEVVNEDVYSPLLSDRITSKIKSCFEDFRFREQAYGENYPFVVGNSVIRLKNELNGLSQNQKLYVILLCSSVLRLAGSSGANRLGHYFEALCGPAFKMLLPPGSDCYFAGSGAGSVHEKRIQGLFFDRITTLCKLLHLTPSANFTRENAGQHNTGDGGVDWVGFLEFPDGQCSQPLFFGQCACGNDWVDKQFDDHPVKWKNYIQFSNTYLTYHFIPRHFRLESLKWQNSLSIYDVVLIDRYRLINLLKPLPELGQVIDQYTPLFEELSQQQQNLSSFI